jgi:probable addiction module antidote protein
MALKTTRWDVDDIMKTKEAIAAYLDAVQEDGHPELLKDALGAIARSKGMTEIAKEAGLGRSSLYRALSPDGNPEFAKVAGVLKAPGLRLSVARERVGRRRATARRRAAGPAIRKSA